jgi:N-acetylglucosaminyl-diphospho-decaprenol L-rhamnosyltransferase
MTTPRVSAVVVSFESRDDLGTCLASLAAHGGKALQTIVVDNASTDGSADVVAHAHPEVKLVRNAANEGFARACNQGASVAGAPYLLFLNPDAQVEPGAVDTMAGVLDDEPTVGIVGPRTLGEDGNAQVSFGPALGLAAEWRQRQLVRGVRRRDPEALRAADGQASARSEPDWVSGSCLLIRREAFDRVSGFDEGFFLYEEDVDLCVRVRAAGWRVLFEPAAVVRHRLGRSMARAADRARLEYHRSHLRYYRKHNGALATAGLRGMLAATALVGWTRSTLAGEAAGRAEHGRALALALRGRA